MHVKVSNTTTLRTFASYDAAVAKVEDFLGPRLDDMKHQLHWLILEVPSAEPSGG
jgi:hypothetical protein